MALHRNPADRFDANLRIITRSGGITPPPEIAALRQRLDDFRRQAFNSAVLDRVVDGIVTGNTDDTAVLWAAACAESTIQDPRKAEVLDAVRAKVNTAIRGLYSEVAIPNYQTLAKQFDKAASAFQRAADLVHPNEAPDLILTASDKIRAAYLSAGSAADELSKLLPVLKAAAELAGLCGPDDDDAVALTVDYQGDITPDEVMHAWTVEERERIEAKQAGAPFTRAAPTHTRGGRWTALHDLGARIRALPAHALTTSA